MNTERSRTPSPGILGGALLVASLSLATSACAQSSSAAIEAAQAGGHFVVCRHAITNDFREREPVDYDDPATQRQLNAEGERQSVRLGEAFERLGLSFTEVVASPMHRAYRTAELMTEGTVRRDSIWHTNGSDYEGPANQARLQALRRPVPDGSVLIVSHIGTMASAIPEARGRVGEGDCVVVRPGEGSHTVVGVVEWEAWLEAAGLGG